MTNASIGDPLTRYAQVNALLAQTYNRTCLKTAYRTLFDAVKNTSWNTPEAENGDRQWFWQTCTEFGFYQSTGSDRQPFGATIPVEYGLVKVETLFYTSNLFMELTLRKKIQGIKWNFIISNRT
jgi:hypothetical protein